MTGSAAFVYPGDLQSRTGGYLYDRHIVDGLRAAGWQVDLHALADSYPWPDAAARAQAAAVINALPDGTLVVMDGLALGALPDVVACRAQRLRWVALVHHPLALETGLDAVQAHALRESEQRALAAVPQVIVTSAATARALVQDYRVPAARVSVIEPGTDAAPLARPLGDGQVRLLCVATLTPRKGHLLLIDALVALPGLPWTLDCAGSLDRDPDTAQAVHAAIAGHGLQGRVRLHGECARPELDALYAQADLCVLPSYHEGYGMALAEALARGLPVLSTTAGAIPDTVPATAGVLVPPGDLPALRDALQRLIEDAPWRARLAEGARAVRGRLPTWRQASERFAAVLAQQAGAGLAPGAADAPGKPRTPRTPEACGTHGAPGASR
jgi:glycosyltransferase involved in cell wall biosynthesis